MSSSALSNYFVDSIIGHEPEDVYAARCVQSSHSASVRPSGVEENADFNACSFASKSTMFPTSWSSVHQPSTATVSGIYHPYIHQSHTGCTDNRYVRSWVDPISNHFSFSGFHSNSRQYGTKTENLAPKKTEASECGPDSSATPDYNCIALVESTPKTAKETTGSDFSNQSEPKDEKDQQLDSSKWQKFFFDLQP